MTAQWYAFYSKPMKEPLLGEQLNLHEIESYYPCLHVKPVNPRARKVKPYFPRYVFGHLDWEQFGHSMLQWLPGAAGIVSFGGIPSPIPDNLIAAIKRRVDEINTVGRELLDGWKRGDILTIQDGSFRGYEAVFDAHISGEERVRVLLRLLSQRQIPLELPARQIQRTKQ
jgi:transcriptional antiterminator RfaH